METMSRKTHYPIMVRKYFSMLSGGTLSIMVVSVMLMSDTLIAGIFLGTDAVAGITQVTPMYTVAAFFGTVFSLGIPILYSSEMGAFRKKEADRVFQCGFLMALITGIVLFLIVSLWGTAFLRLSHPSEEVLAAAEGYLSFIRFTILLLPLQALLAECVFIDGDETVSTIANLVQAAGNVVFSVILSRVIGTAGIALASFLFYVISLLILCAHFFKKGNTLRPGFFFSVDIIRRVIRYSVIDAGSYLFIGILTAVLNLFVGVRFGSRALILVSVISLGREFQMIFDGIGAAITPIITIYLSEDCTTGVRRIYRLAEKTAIAEGVIVTILTCIAAPFVPIVLQITDPSLTGFSVAALRIISLGSVFVSLLYLMSSYDLLIDRIPLGLLTSLLRDVLLAAPLAVILGYYFGVFGMFAGIALAPALALFLIRFWLEKKNPGDTPLLLGEKKDCLSFLYDLILSSYAIAKTRDAVGETLLAHAYDDKTVNRVILLFEEVCMLIYEKNKGKQIEAECSLLLSDDRIRLILRDTGETFDVTDADLTVSSLRSYVVSNVATHVSRQKQHLIAMSFNRNAFEIKASSQ